MFDNWFGNNILAPIFTGWTGLLTFGVYLATMFILERVKPDVFNGISAFIMLAIFLLFMLTWTYFATGQHLKPTKE